MTMAEVGAGIWEGVDRVIEKRSAMQHGACSWFWVFTTLKSEWLVGR